MEGHSPPLPPPDTFGGYATHHIFCGPSPVHCNPPNDPHSRFGALYERPSSVRMLIASSCFVFRTDLGLACRERLRPRTLLISLKFSDPPIDIKTSQKHTQSHTSYIHTQ
jgi:hypothetical protein